MVRPRNTKQRQLILDVLRETSSHPSADWVYQRVREIMPSVSLGTVYRNLGVLKEQELIQELRHTGSQSRYDGNPLPHYHFFCGKCGRIDDVSLRYSSRGEEAFMEQMPGYVVLGRSTDYFGYCPSCSAQPKEGEEFMAVFVCKECDEEKESRCKPRKCPNCNAVDSFAKKD